MDWKDEEVGEGYKVAQEHGRFVDHATLRAIMTRAVELAAERFSTMTDETLRYALRSEDWGGIEREFALHGARLMSLSEQIGAKEARVAVLEADLGLARKGFDPGSPAEVEIRSLRERCEDLEARRLAAEEGNRELVRRAQQAESLLERERKHHAETRKMHSQMCRVSVEHQRRAEAAEARCATLSADGQVKSANVDKADGHEGCPDNPCPAHFPYCEGVNKDTPQRWPCSPTCTHDDAAKPGHPERVKERSVEMRKAALLDYAAQKNDWRPADADAYDAGAEAMRAACWEAVQAKLNELGFSSPFVMSQFKSAIEGAVL